MEYTPQDYALDKAHKDSLEIEVNFHSVRLKAFPRLANGLTPDNIKVMSEYQAVKRAYDIAFHNLREFNGAFVKRYKKELSVERAMRAKQRKGE